MNTLSSETMFNTFCKENKIITIVSQFVEAVYSKDKTKLDHLYNKHSFLKGLSLTKEKGGKKTWDVAFDDIVEPINQLSLFSVSGNINDKNINIKSVYFYKELINNIGHLSLRFDKINDDIKTELFLCDPRTGNNLSCDYVKGKEIVDIVMYNKDSEFNILYKAISFLKANTENFEHNLLAYITQAKPLNISQEKKDTFFLLHDIDIDNSIYLKEIKNNIFELKEDYKIQPKKISF